MSDFHRYYWASNIKKIIFWNVKIAPNEDPLWAGMELTSSPVVLWSLVCSQLSLPTKSVAQNTIVSETLKIVSQFRKQIGLYSPSKLAQFFWNPSFLPSCSDLTFESWSDRGLLTLEDLYIDGIFHSFADLSKNSLSLSLIYSVFSDLTFCSKSVPSIS